MHVLLRRWGLGFLLVAAWSLLARGEEPLPSFTPGTAWAQSAGIMIGRDGGSPRASAEPTTLRLPVALIRNPLPQDSFAAASSGDAARRLPLPPRRTADSSDPSAAPTPGRAAVTAVTSLAVVLGLFLLLVWFQRRTAPRRCSLLPGDVFETLGRVPLNARQEMHLVRVGNKLLLLAVTAAGAETLTEITDAQEIDRLSGICRHSRPDSISASFREILSQLSRQPPAGGLNYVPGR